MVEGGEHSTFSSGEDFRRAYFPTAVERPADAVGPAANHPASGVEMAERLLEELAQRLGVLHAVGARRAFSKV